MSNHNYALSTRRNIGGCLFVMRTDAEWLAIWEGWLLSDIRNPHRIPELVVGARERVRKGRQIFRDGGAA